MTVRSALGSVTADFLSLLVLLVLQVNVRTVLPAGWSQLNVLVVAVTYRSIRRGWTATLWYAVAGGLLYDLYAPQPFGSSAVSLSVVALEVGLLAQWVVTNRTVPAYVTLAIVGGITATVAEVTLAAAATAAGVNPWPTTAVAGNLLRFVPQWVAQLMCFAVVLVLQRRELLDPTTIRPARGVLR